MATVISNNEKKDWAKLLFIQNELTQKEIAQKVKVSEKTMSKWVNDPDDNWEGYRKSLLTTKNEILRNLYSHLDTLSKKLKDVEDKDASKNADAYVKFTAAIKNLETETSIASIIEVARMFTNWIQPLDPKFALDVANHFDAFIKERLKRF